MRPLVINLSLFKAGWLAAVFAAAATIPAIGTAAVALVVVVHLARTEHPRAETLLLVAAAIIGAIWESLLVQTGTLSYTTGIIADSLAPYWIVAMWVLFATTLNIGMRWLRKGWLIAAAAGAVGGPLSFIAGEKVGAVAFADPVSSLIVISAGWAILLPLLVQIAEALESREAGKAYVRDLLRES